MEQKKITDYTETELKSMAYDQIILLEQCQMNVRAINEELATRLTEEPKKEK